MKSKIYSRQKIEDYLKEVYQLFQEFLALQEKYIKKKRKLWNILKPIDYTKSHVETELLLSKYDTIKQNLNKDEYFANDNNYGECFKCLVKYVRAIIDAMECFNKIVCLLDGKSKGEKYSYENYSNLIEEFNFYENKYI